MASPRSDSVIALSGFPPLVPNVPPNWPTRPTPGKISLLWEANFHELYHKFSPFTNYHDSLLGGILSDKQPFVYTYIDEAGQGLISSLPSLARNILSLINVTQDTVNDVARVAKFEISSHGVEFLGAQTLLQRLQPFDETRIYNPLSSLLSTVQPMTIGLLNRPTRHIEPSLSGLVSAAGLGNFLPSSATIPQSSAGAAALSDFNLNQGKGLLRGQTATTGYARLTTAFPGNGPLGSFQGIIASGKAAVDSLFGSTSQPGSTKVRADEGTYGLMAISSRLNVYQTWYGNSQTVLDPPNQPKSISNLGAGLATINSTVSGVLNAISNPLSLVGNFLGSLFNMVLGWGTGPFTRQQMYSTSFGFRYIKINNGINGVQLKGRQPTLTIGATDKYGNVVGIAPKGSFDKSNMIIQWTLFSDPDGRFNTKFDQSTDPNVQDYQNTLQQVLANINAPDTQYSARTTKYSKLLSSGDFDAIGYNALWDTVPTTGDTVDNPRGVRQEYRNGQNTPRTLDKGVSSNNLRFAASFASDGINQVGILKKNKQGDIAIPYRASLNAEYPNWTKYKPYDDDLVAFFFYDVVNQKYIPFRATVKAISEGNTAFWDELRFIGRADQLYSYNGYSRTLSFNFNVVINSVAELLPSWRKINYIASAVKPSNYTRSNTVAGAFNRFMVPPMFMITIGDLYKFQPIVMRNVTVNIPEDAIWETLNQDNSKEWSYLSGIIKSPFLNNDYGQLPREVEISVEGALLEKERAMVGGSHFGHAPRVDNWEDFLDNDGNLDPAGFNVGAAGTEAATFLPTPTDLHSHMIEVNPPASPDQQLFITTPPNVPQPNNAGLV